jgi:hypothetical protein
MHGVADTERLKLSAEPDGFGFFYGWVERNGERVRVDVLPPEHLWRGDNELKAREVAKMYGVSERTLWRNLRWAADVEAIKGT